MINFEDLWFAIMFMARSIAMASALYIDDSFGRHFNSSWFWKIDYIFSRKLGIHWLPCISF